MFSCSPIAKCKCCLTCSVLWKLEILHPIYRLSIASAQCRRLPATWLFFVLYESPVEDLLRVIILTALRYYLLITTNVKLCCANLALWPERVTGLPLSRSQADKLLWGPPWKCIAQISITSFALLHIGWKTHILCSKTIFYRLGIVFIALSGTYIYVCAYLLRILRDLMSKSCSW